MKIDSLKAGAGWVWAVLGAMLLGLMLLAPAGAGAVTLTSVQGTVYRADGSPANGTLIVTWPGFSTSGNEAVAAGTLAVTIGADGYVQVALAPNQGAYPEGSYYTAVYHLSDGTVSREYWVVPAAAQATVAGVRAVVAAANVATQSVSKTYVDAAVAGIGNAYLAVAGGAMNGPLTLAGDPTGSTQAASKHYTDSTAAAAAATAVPLAGGAMNGALMLSGDPVLGSSNSNAAVTLNWANRWPCNSSTAGGARGFQSYVDITCYGAVGDSLMITGGLVTHVGSNVVLSTGSTTGVFPTGLQGNMLVVGQGGVPYNGSAAYPGAALYGYAQYVSDHEVHLFSDKGLTQPLNAGSEVGGSVTKIAGTSSGGGWTTATCSVSGGNAGLLSSANGGYGYATGAACTATVQSGNVSCAVASPGLFYTVAPVVTVSGNAGTFTNICTATIAWSGSGYASGAHSAADSAAITSAYNAARLASLPLYVPPMGSAGLHDSRDAWGYWFAGPALSGWGRPEFAGADEFTSTIIVAPTTYLVDDANPWFSMNIHDMGFFGGIGYFRTRALTVLDTGHYVVANNSFHGFTGTAFASNQVDNPYWLFEHNTCIAANTWSGICISMGGANDSTKVEDNHFDNQRAGFKSAGTLSTVRIDRNEWMQYQTEPVPGTWMRTGIWLAGAAANDVIAENKWGNENKDQTDVAMLAANGDATNCNDPFAVGLYGACPLSNQLPLIGVQANFQIRGMHVKSNLVEGAGYASQPFLYSYTADVERNEFTDFIIDGAALGYVIDVDTATNPTVADFQYTNLCGPYLSLHPAHTLSQTGGSNLAGLCTENEPTGVYTSNNAFSIDPNTTGSNQAGFNNLLTVGAGALTKDLAADGVKAIADSQGTLATTAATLQWTTAVRTDFTGLTGTLTPNEPLWIEMDLRTTAGCSGAACLADVYPTVTNATGTVTYYGQQFAVPVAGTGWKHYRRLMWWPRGGQTGLVFHMAPGPDAPVTGGTVDVGLIHVYQAWEPATGSQVLDTLSVTGGAKLGGPMVLSANTQIQPAPGAGAGTVFQTPATNGSAGFVLTTDGTGATQWTAAAATSAVTLGGGTMSGPLLLNNDPTLALGAATKKYVDNGTGVLSLKQQGAACDGVTDDTSVVQSAVTAAAASGQTLMFPPNASCVTKAQITASGVVRWQGNHTTLLMSPASVTRQMFGFSGISSMDISGLTFSGSSNVVSGVVIAGGTNQNIRFHGNTFTGISGCAPNPNTWTNAALYLSGASHVRIDDNFFTNNGCAAYWYTGGPTGLAIYHGTTPDYDWDVSGNLIDGTNDIFGMLFFDLFESTVHDNNVRNIVLGGAGGNNDANSSGYGVAFYGTVICGNSTLASPGGLSRTGNVVTFNFSGTCSPGLAAGDHITLLGSTAVGGTGFDGGYTITTGGTTSATAVADTGGSLANDTGGGGTEVAYLPRLNTVHNNRFKNLAGSAIYMQTNSDSIASNNVMYQVCQSMDDTSLPCGFVAANLSSRLSINGNTGTGSVKDGVVTSGGTGLTIYGNAVGNARYAIRLRGTEAKHAVFGNTVNGAVGGDWSDGASTQTVHMGNTFAGISSANMEVSNSGSTANIFAANQMDGGSTSGVVGLQILSGNQNIAALNIGNKFRASVFDLRSYYNTAALNGVFNGASGVVGFWTGSGAYNVIFRNYCQNLASSCINDNNAGQSNVFSQNYMSAVGQTILNNHGVSLDNHLVGGVAGNYLQYSCTLVAGTCTVTTTEVQSTDTGSIWCWRGTAGANAGYPYLASITAGVSFVVKSTSAMDTGNVTCRITH